MLQLVAGQPPLLVVEVLPAPGGVGADGLDVPVRIRADPDVLPCRWDDQRRDPLARLGIHGVAVRVDVRPARASAAPAQPRPLQVATAQPHVNPPPVFRSGLARAYPVQEGSSREAIISSATARSLRFRSWE